MLRFCDLCGRELTPVFPKHAKRHTDDQYEKCLHIYLMGGYGEYYDNLLFEDFHKRLCEKCADEFMQNPILKKIFAEWME